MTDTTHAAHDTVGHVTSIRLLVAVWIALMIGTWLTVTATYVDLGAVNIWIGLAIATAKALLVGLYFMHLRWDKPFNAFVFLASFAFLALFIGLAMMDTAHYQPRLIPGFAPGMARVVLTPPLAGPFVAPISSAGEAIHLLGKVPLGFPGLDLYLQCAGVDSGTLLGITNAATTHL